MKKQSTQPPEGGTTNEASQARYTVLAKAVQIGSVIAYRGAVVVLTKEQADALNTAQPGTVEFCGI